MYIVTGGAGLIGSTMIWRLNQEGIRDILVVDHLAVSEKWKNLTPLRFADYRERGDFLQDLRNGVYDTVDIQGIFHFGACSCTTERDAEYLVHNNFEYTKELARYAVRRQIRMVYASSCATYGDGSCGYRDDDSRIEELRPLNMYGYSKQLFDLWAREHGLLPSLIGCKFSNVYGPNERHKGEMRSVVLRAFEQISACGRMKLFRSLRPEYRDGEQMRDFLYVKDAVEMVLFLFRHPEAHGLYNIGSGRAETWNALTTAVFEAMDKPVDIEYIDMPEHLRDRYQYYTCTEMAKLFALGYDRPVTPLSDAVRDYVRNYLLTGKYLGDE
ncbi:MAG: ADP-glyceromanno-heptose 6-epimerase [Lentisphaeria bacterium]|nr:ADP-glyceromanno-heptose 6-epimerase [Lentisphaeria bacterium]